MRTIYISPHLDDAVLSAGGLIFDQAKSGLNIEVWTFMCAIPREVSSEKYISRMLEDRTSLKILGAIPVHYCFLDAIDRKDFEGNKLYSTVFGPVNPNDKITPAITHLIKMELKPDDILICPLAVGLHVDHVIIRNACEELDVPLIYLIDFPYIEYLPDALEPAVVGLKKYPVAISQKGLSMWIAAMKEYRSQDLYPTQEITREKITEYWAKTNGIYLWEKI